MRSILSNPAQLASLLSGQQSASVPQFWIGPNGNPDNAGSGNWNAGAPSPGVNWSVPAAGEPIGGAIIKSGTCTLNDDLSYAGGNINVQAMGTGTFNIDTTAVFLGSLYATGQATVVVNAQTTIHGVLNTANLANFATNATVDVTNVVTFEGVSTVRLTGSLRTTAAFIIQNACNFVATCFEVKGTSFTIDETSIATFAAIAPSTLFISGATSIYVGQLLYLSAFVETPSLPATMITAGNVTINGPFNLPCKVTIAGTLNVGAVLSGTNQFSVLTNNFGDLSVNSPNNIVKATLNLLIGNDSNSYVVLSEGSANIQTAPSFTFVDDGQIGPQLSYTIVTTSGGVTCPLQFRPNVTIAGAPYATVISPDGLTLLWGAMANLSGTCKRGSSTPVQGATISVTDQNNVTAVAISDAAGNYICFDTNLPLTWQIAPGSVTVTCTAPAGFSVVGTNPVVMTINPGSRGFLDWSLIPNP